MTTVPYEPTPIYGFRTVHRIDQPVVLTFTPEQFDNVLMGFYESNAWLIEKNVWVDVLFMIDCVVMGFPDPDLAFEFRMRWM